MGLNFKSHRISEIKKKLSNITDHTDTPFTKQVALLTELLKIQTISRTNCRWARKYLHNTMRVMYRDPGTIAEMDALEQLFVSAEERRERRQAKRLAEKEVGKRSKKQPTKPVPVAPAPGNDVWDLL